MRRFLLPISLLFLTTRLAVAQLGVEPEFPARQNLGPSLNSAGIEILPVVSPDGKTLYFDRKYDSTNVGGVDDDDDIYYSTLRNDGTWSPARNIGPPLNTRGSDVLFWISADGSSALVHNGEIVNGKKTGLAISHREGSSWGKPVPISIDGLADLGDSYYAFITPDQKRLILGLHLDKPDDEDFDLFTCDATSNDLMRWGKPEPIKALNTEFFEGAPFMASDNRTLYFTSDRPNGMGETDVYITRRIGNSWEMWSTPENMGPSVNTPLYEASISITAQGDFAYMSGTGFYEAFYGKSDLFRIQLPDSLRPQRVVLVNGRMLVGDRGAEGLVRAEIAGKSGDVTSTASDSYGRFLLLLPAGEQYRITGFAPGHGETSVEVDARRNDPVTRSVILNFDVASATPRASDSDLTASLSVGPILFATGSSELSPEALEELRRYVGSIREAIANGGGITRVGVTGHTDDVGESDSNQQLSLSRAASVRRWLIANGISPKLISTDARGEIEPVASNETEEGRAKNRRVEIRVISARK